MFNGINQAKTFFKNANTCKQRSKKRLGEVVGEQERKFGKNLCVDTNGVKFDANTATLKSASFTTRKVEIINGKKFIVMS